MNSILDEDFEIVAKYIYDLGIKNSTFLISGATGLIGSLLCKALLKANDIYHLNNKAIALVRNENKAKEIFKDFQENPFLSTYICDLSKDRIKMDSTVDYVIHTASITASKQMVTQPVETIDVALNGTKSILDFAKCNHVKKVIYLSSMEVYGVMSTEGKVDETQLGFVNLSNVRSCYPEGKRICECICNAYCSEYNIDVSVARLAQTFGAGISKEENRVFAQFIRSALSGNDIVLHTRGLSEGNYVYTSDALSAIFTLIVKGKKASAYNVANESCHTTIREMAEMVANEFGVGQSKVLVELPNDNQTFGYAPDTKLFLDSKKIRELGWQPKYDLKECYHRLAKWIELNEGGIQ